MNPEASLALRFSVAKMRAAGRVDEKARVGVRKLLESYAAIVSHASPMRKDQEDHNAFCKQLKTFFLFYCRNLPAIALKAPQRAHYTCFCAGGYRIQDSSGRRTMWKRLTWLANWVRRILRQLMTAVVQRMAGGRSCDKYLVFCKIRGDDERSSTNSCDMIGHTQGLGCYRIECHLSELFSFTRSAPQKAPLSSGKHYRTAFVATLSYV